jgi:hypothetical protein
MRNNKNAEFMQHGNRVLAMQRDLVQWNLTQMHSHNKDHNGAYLAPIIALDNAESSWTSMTEGMSAEELADMDQARSQLEHYKKLYEMFEYCEHLNETMETLQTRMASQNPANVFNMYRQSSSTEVNPCFTEVEECLTAYYELQDDCADNDDWARKIEEELGSTVSYLAMQMCEGQRDAIVEKSEVFHRFDLEK